MFYTKEEKELFNKIISQIKKNAEKSFKENNTLNSNVLQKKDKSNNN